MATPELVFGLHSVQPLIQHSPTRIIELWLLDGRQDKRMGTIRSAAEKQGLKILYKPRSALDERCAGNHQGVIAFVQPSKGVDETELYQLLEGLSEAPLLMVLDGVTDPHNLGACLRSANAAGVHAVIVPKDNSAGLNEVVRKVACGAAELTPLVTVTNLARTLKKLQDLGLWVVGTTGDSQVAIYDAPLTGPLVIVMGAEGCGMRRLTRELCDHLAYIPMAGGVSSLNVSVAAGVCLFEAVRQRQRA